MKTQNQDSTPLPAGGQVRENYEPFWITGAHPITGHRVANAEERREQERPAKHKKLTKQNWK